MSATPKLPLLKVTRREVDINTRTMLPEENVSWVKQDETMLPRDSALLLSVKMSYWKRRVFSLTLKPISDFLKEAQNMKEVRKYLKCTSYADRKFVAYRIYRHKKLRLLFDKVDIAIKDVMNCVQAYGFKVAAAHLTRVAILRVGAPGWFLRPYEGATVDLFRMYIRSDVPGVPEELIVKDQRALYLVEKQFTTFASLLWNNKQAWAVHEALEINKSFVYYENFVGKDEAANKDSEDSEELPDTSLHSTSPTDGEAIANAVGDSMYVKIKSNYRINEAVILPTSLSYNPGKVNLISTEMKLWKLEVLRARLHPFGMYMHQIRKSQIYVDYYQKKSQHYLRLFADRLLHDANLRGLFKAAGITEEQAMSIFYRETVNMAIVHTVRIAIIKILAPEKLVMSLGPGKPKEDVTDVFFGIKDKYTNLIDAGMRLGDTDYLADIFTNVVSKIGSNPNKVKLFASIGCEPLKVRVTSCDSKPKGSATAYYKEY